MMPNDTIQRTSLTTDTCAFLLFGVRPDAVESAEVLPEVCYEFAFKVVRAPTHAICTTFDSLGMRAPTHAWQYPKTQIHHGATFGLSCYCASTSVQRKNVTYGNRLQETIKNASFTTDARAILR
jgi:hypothetical protein